MDMIIIEIVNEMTKEKAKKNNENEIMIMKKK